MIDLDLRLPLACFVLEVRVRVESDAVAVMGPSGSGKTSLFEAIAGLRRASGRIAIDGERVLDSGAAVDLPPDRRRVGYVPQDALLFPHLTVEENVRFGLARAAPAQRLFRESVSILEIEPLLPRYPATLSGGERQRVALARAVATQPRLLLLDEPLAGVDVELKERILPYLLRLRDEKHIPLLYVTHNAGEALLLAREVLLLRSGRVEALEPAVELLSAGRLATLDPLARFDNLVEGLVEAGASGGTARLRLSNGTVLQVPAGSIAAGRSVYSVAPEDVLLSTQPLDHVSARNVLAGEVEDVDLSRSDALVRVRSGGIEWRGRVTAESARELNLAPGVAVWLAIKTHALRRLH